ncbi:corrinoid adenosyltransferase-like [Amphibalanus amphitrite]|uniref:corrinoid adenosyltransferase-like n=1 Tax=Amphibalanus amphitrite TaxID=1232801 RepID=UPI001C9278AE|nr:corrinoid adenosyltransferase-like [Amphibalanus amphitrite]
MAACAGVVPFTQCRMLILSQIRLSCCKRTFSNTPKRLTPSSGNTNRPLRPLAGGAATRGLRIYTKTGDGGTSSTFTGQRLPKDDALFEALGSVDELSATVGLARVLARDAGHTYCWQLERVQCALQEVGSLVATPRGSARPAHTRRTGQRVPAAWVTELEAWIDEHTARLPPLTNFILPGGGVAGATLHLARTVCRRAERVVTPLTRADRVDASVAVYLNRLSDFLFTVARVAAAADGVDEEVYVRPPPGQPSE